MRLAGNGTRILRDLRTGQRVEAVLTQEKEGRIRIFFSREADVKSGDVLFPLFPLPPGAPLTVIAPPREPPRESGLPIKTALCMEGKDG